LLADFSGTVCGFFFIRITIAYGVTLPDTITPPPNGSLAAGLPSPRPIADNVVLQWLHLGNTSATIEFNGWIYQIGTSHSNAQCDGLSEKGNRGTGYRRRAI
jgi:hypothetical protein